MSDDESKKILTDNVGARIIKVHKLLTDKKVLTECDAELFSRYSTHVKFAHEAEELIKQHGLLVPDEDGILRKNPAMQIFRDNSMAALKFESELGLSPAARMRLARPESETAEDEYSEFRKS